MKKREIDYRVWLFTSCFLVFFPTFISIAMYSGIQGHGYSQIDCIHDFSLSLMTVALSSMITCRDFYISCLDYHLTYKRAAKAARVLRDISSIFAFIAGFFFIVTFFKYGEILQISTSHTGKILCDFTLALNLVFLAIDFIYFSKGGKLADDIFDETQERCEYIVEHSRYIAIRNKTSAICEDTENNELVCSYRNHAEIKRTVEEKEREGKIEIKS